VGLPYAKESEYKESFATANSSWEAPPVSKQTNEGLEVAARILLRCWILGFILLLFWWGAITLAGDLVLGVHGEMFDLTRSQLTVIHYCGMGLTKLAVGLFFFIPWVSIRMVLKKAKS